MPLPNIPRKEDDILSYCMSILDFIEKHEELGLKKEKDELVHLLKEYQKKRDEKELAHKAYQKKTYSKDQSLAELITKLRSVRKRVTLLPAPQKERLRKSIPIIDRLSLPPAAARELVGERVAAGQVSLSWKRPKRGTGGRVIFFEIHSKESNSTHWTILDTTDGVRESTVIRNLAEGIELDFKIVSKNQVGRSEEASNIVRLIL
ncbi:MAG: fibronectin type III domain-containing protein [Sumerlaeia bacterium]